VKVIIPAAGRGTRLYPHTLYTPKPLLKVAGKPILFYILQKIQDFDVESIYVVISHGYENVIDFVRKFFPRSEVKGVYQDRRLGLGHAVYQAVKKIKNLDGDLLILLSDTIFEADFEEFLKTREDFLVVKEVENPKHYGVAVVDDDYIVDLEEKPDHPKSNLAIIGVYYINDAQRLKSSLEYIINHNVKTRGEFQLTDALKIMLNEGWKPKAIRAKEWIDCGTPSSLLKANRKLLNRIDNSEKVEVNGDSIVIHPVYIGNNVRLRRSVIGPYVSIGDWSQIISSVIHDTIIDENVKISNYILENSILSYGTILEGDSKSVSLSAFSNMSGL